MRPSVTHMLETASTIESLGAMRLEIARALAAGEIDPAPKTVVTWVETLWLRVLALMAEQPAAAPYIFNVTLTWEKPEGLQAALEAQMKLYTAPLPAPAEILS